MSSEGEQSEKIYPKYVSNKNEHIHFKFRVLWMRDSLVVLEGCRSASVADSTAVLLRVETDCQSALRLGTARVSRHCLLRT